MYSCLPVSRPTRTTSVGFEPITLDEAKRQLGNPIGFDADIGALVTAAREQVERDAMLVVATVTYTWKFTAFDYADYFELPGSLRPVSSITSIYYTATDGTNTQWSTSAYTLDTAPQVPIVRLNYGYSWPTIRSDINGVTVTLVAGYASAAVVPERIKQAVKLKLHELWQVRMEQPFENTMRAYDAIVNQLRPEVYA